MSATKTQNNRQGIFSFFCFYNLTHFFSTITKNANIKTILVSTTEHKFKSVRTEKQLLNTNFLDMTANRVKMLPRRDEE